MKKFRFSMILVLSLALILGACTTPAVQTPTEETSEETTLVVWDQFYREEESK